MPRQPDPLAVLFAIRAETRPFRRALGRCEAPGVPRARGWGVWGDAPIVWAISGMGERRAHECAAALISEAGPRALLIAGFCGGLARPVAVGDLVCATSALSAARDGRLEPAPTWLASALAALRVGGLTVHEGAMLSVDRPLLTAAEKQAAAAGRPTAVALDMETYGAAAAAEEAGLPWLAIRAVTDGLHDALPPGLDRETADGQPDTVAIARAVALSPRDLPRLLGIARATSKAALALGDATLLVAAATAGLSRPLHPCECE
ncbi:MAG: hypothetical protein NT029_05620 [Armatimonadetes bacterium]|nr:hypothetical protein [Armatimonadota bacterium]